MKKSKELDEKTNSFYPDTLTMELNRNEITQSKDFELSSVDIERLDLMFFLEYGSSKYMGLVLDFNKVEHRSILKPGDVLRLPSKGDLDRYILKYRKNDS